MQDIQTTHLQMDMGRTSQQLHARCAWFLNQIADSQLRNQTLQQKLQQGSQELLQQQKSIQIVEQRIDQCKDTIASRHKSIIAQNALIQAYTREIEILQSLIDERENIVHILSMIQDQHQNPIHKTVKSH